MFGKPRQTDLWAWQFPALRLCFNWVSHHIRPLWLFQGMKLPPSWRLSIENHRVLLVNHLNSRGNGGKSLIIEGFSQLNHL